MICVGRWGFRGDPISIRRRPATGRTGGTFSLHHCRTTSTAGQNMQANESHHLPSPWHRSISAQSRAKAVHSPMSPPRRALHSPRSREPASGKADASGRSVPESEERRSDHFPLQAPQAPQAAKTYLTSPGPQSRNRPTPFHQLPSRPPSTPDSRLSTPDSHNYRLRKSSSFKPLSQRSAHCRFFSKWTASLNSKARCWTSWPCLPACWAAPRS